LWGDEANNQDGIFLDEWFRMRGLRTSDDDFAGQDSAKGDDVGLKVTDSPRKEPLPKSSAAASPLQELVGQPAGNRREEPSSRVVTQDQYKRSGESEVDENDGPSVTRVRIE
jgi:hypothetical protein